MYGLNRILADNRAPLRSQLVQLVLGIFLVALSLYLAEFCKIQTWAYIIGGNRFLVYPNNPISLC